MKSIAYLLLFSFVIYNGCGENPKDSVQDTVLRESKTIINDYYFHRDSSVNTDTLIISIGNIIPDVYIFINYYLGQRFLNSFSYSILQSDTAITNANFIVQPNNIQMMWTTAFEVNNSGWEIQRKDYGGSYSTIGFVSGRGTTNNTNTYYYTDNVNLSKVIHYRFKQIHFNGTFEYTLEAKIEVEATDSISMRYSMTADNGVIKYDGDIAPENGYEYNILVKPNDLIYFRNSLGQYGKIRFQSYNSLNDHSLKIDENSKNLIYNLSYEIFLQTNGGRYFF